MVLLKNDGILPLRKGLQKIAVIGPTADQLTSILGNYVGTPMHPVTPLDGMLQQFGASSVIYAQGATMAEGFAVPVPRTVFGRGLKTEYYATTDCTGRPAATATSPNIQTDWVNAVPVPELATHSYSVCWSGSLQVPVAGHYVFSLEPGDSFPYSPVEHYRFILDGKLVSEGSLRLEKDRETGGLIAPAPGASPTAPVKERFPQPVSIPLDFSDSKPHDVRVEYVHEGDRAGGGLILKWQAPVAAQLEEAIESAKQADIVVAFVGLSPQLEGEELKIKMDGFVGGDRTRIDLPPVQEKLLESLAATGKPLVVVLQSGSAVSLNWAKEHAAAILEAWYPGVEGGTAVARTLAGLYNPSGRLPVTFYAGIDDLPAFEDYSMKGRTYRYYTGKQLWGFGYGLSYSTFKYDALHLSSEKLKAGDSLTVHVQVRNTGQYAGDEVIQLYMKTPQKDAPLRSLVAFRREHFEVGESKDIELNVIPRLMSSVLESGERRILEGKYTVSAGGAQPQDAASSQAGSFEVIGSLGLAK